MYDIRCVSAYLILLVDELFSKRSLCTQVIYNSLANISVPKVVCYLNQSITSQHKVIVTPSLKDQWNNVPNHFATNSECSNNIVGIT